MIVVSTKLVEKKININDDLPDCNDLSSLNSSEN